MYYATLQKIQPLCGSWKNVDLLGFIMAWETIRRKKHKSSRQSGKIKLILFGLFFELDIYNNMQYIAYMQVTNDQILNMMPPKFGLFGLLFAFMNRLQAAGDSFYEEISCKQWFLLACMNLYGDNAPTANELAEIMGCSRQNVKEILNALAKKEILVLKQDDNDKRKQRIYLTSKQKRLAKKYQNKEMDFLKFLYVGISDDEIRSVFKIISKMEKNLIKAELVS